MTDVLNAIFVPVESKHVKGGCQHAGEIDTWMRIELLLDLRKSV